MENKITKNLIIFGAIVFSFVFASNAFAECRTYAFSDECIQDQYTTGYYQPQQYEYGYNSYNSNNNNVYYPSNSNSSTTKPTSTVVNNYYYPTPKSTTTTTSNTNTTATSTQKDTTNTSSNTTASNTNGASTNNGVYNNGLGASAYNGYNGQTTNSNGITALSLAGSGGFMPSSIWQWIFVVILILVIVIIGRMFVHKPSPSDHDVHAPHAH